MSPVAPCFACSPPTLSTQHPRSPLFADYHQDGQNAPFYILLEPPMAVVVGCTGASSPLVCRCSSADEDAQLIVRRASHWRAAASTARVPLRPRSSSSSLRHPSPPFAPLQVCHGGRIQQLARKSQYTRSRSAPVGRRPLSADDALNAGSPRVVVPGVAHGAPAWYLNGVSLTVSSLERARSDVGLLTVT